MKRFLIHPINPQMRILDNVVDLLKHENGIVAYPTDTVYGMGACVSNPKAIDAISRLLNKDKKRLFSFICSDFSQISIYVHVSNTHYKLMKHYLPGPYTFILPATNIVPKKVCPKRKTVGIRIPDNAVTRELVTLLGEPLANTSLPLLGSLRGDPDNFDKSILNGVDVLLDTGPLDNPVGSTIIDLTDDDPKLIREGKGVWHG